MTGDDTRMLRERHRAALARTKGTTMTDDTRRILRNALADAAAWRRALTDTCGCAIKADCPDCVANLSDAADYDQLAQALGEPPFPPLPRADDVVTRDGLL